MSQSTVSRIERDPKRASVDELNRIAAALGVDVTALVSAITESTE